MMLPSITPIKFELRSIPEQYRAFARECMKWADSANTISSAKYCWTWLRAEAGARLDHQHAFIGQFGELTKANLPQYTKVSAAHGSGLSNQTNGSDQPKQPEAASHAKYQRVRREHSVSADRMSLRAEVRPFLEAK